ncbi:hypothetical protein [Tolypothrix sp. VBCCA 56010]
MMDAGVAALRLAVRVGGASRREASRREGIALVLRVIRQLGKRDRTQY